MRAAGPSSGGRAAGLRAGADVHVVDHDLADLVDDQVDRRGSPSSSTRAASSMSSGMLVAAGEVVAGAERQQPEHRVRELVAPVQRR